MNKEQSVNTTLEQVFKVAAEREKPISRLFQLEDVLKDVCEKIKKELGFDFAAIQLIRPEEKIIETVAGGEWIGRVRHYLEKDSNLRNIQADIAQTCRTEIIAGWDKRFDRWIYEEFGHKDLVHIFTPILLIRDENDKTNNNWFNNCEYLVIQDDVNEDWFRNRELRDRANGINGQHTIIEVDLSKLNLEKDRTLIEVIGTVEVGYKNPQQQIKPKKAIDFIKFVAEQALEISPYRFSSVLEKLADTTKTVVNADAGSLYFLVKPIQNPYIHEIENGKIRQRFLKVEEHENHIPYIYQAFSGSIGWYFLRNCPPRKKNELKESALGQQALDTKKYQFISDSERLKSSNLKAFQLGMKAMAAFPIIIEHKQEIKTGVLYLYFKDESKCTKEQLKKAEVLANRAVAAIQHAITYQNLRDQSDQLMTLQAVAQSLAQIPDKEKLLHHLAWNTLNILAADVVTIYEYIYTDDPEKAFPSPRTIAGKLKDKDKVSIKLKLDENHIPFSLVEEGKNIYVEQITHSPIFRDSSFANREDIKSVAGILLKIGKFKIGKGTEEQIVGVMFINYRRPHEFSDEEKQLIEILASSAAIAIMNQVILTEIIVESTTGEREQSATRNQVFISYSHQDSKWLAQLQKQLKPMIRNQTLEVWDDTKIKPGVEWREEIKTALMKAKVAVLLVSPDFLDSDFIDKNELPPLLNAAQKEGLTIIWIPLTYSSYDETAIEKYQAVHDPNKPLQSLKPAERNKAWVSICKQIKTAMQSSKFGE